MTSTILAKLHIGSFRWDAIAPGRASRVAVFVLVGGLLQALLVAGSWMIHRGEPERAALAKSYQSLADYASDLAAARLTPPLPIAFPASSALDDANPFLAAPERLTLLDLLEQAERLRASLAAMAAQAAIRESDDKKDIQKLASETATVLNLMADALRVGRAERPNRVRDVISRVARLKVVAQAPWRWAGEALLGQLRAVARILAQFDGMPAQPSARHRESDSAFSPSEVGFIPALATLRANVTLATEAGRHAVRLAIVAGLAEAIVQGTGLSQGRWVVLTIFLVLKPDYNSTLSRSFH